MAEEKKLIGKVTHYFNKIGVAIVDLEDTLAVGDTVSIEGHTTNIQQKVDSIQIEHENVQNAVKGQSVGLKVSDKVHESDNVYKVVQ